MAVLLQGRFRLEEVHLFGRDAETHRVMLDSTVNREWLEINLKDAQEFAKFPLGTQFEVIIKPVETEEHA